MRDDVDPLGDAWRVLVAAVVAQQAAAEEFDRHIHERAESLAREEDELAGHLERQRRALLEFQDQVAASRAALRRELADVRDERRQLTDRAVDLVQLGDAVEQRRDRLRRLVRGLRQRFRRERERASAEVARREAELRREREYLAADRDRFRRQCDELAVERRSVRAAIVQLRGYVQSRVEVAPPANRPVVAAEVVIHPKSNVENDPADAARRERLPAEARLRTREAEAAVRDADLDRRAADLDAREQLLAARESALGGVIDQCGRHRDELTAAVARWTNAAAELTARLDDIDRERERLTAEALALDDYRRRYCDDEVAPVVFERRMERARARWRRHLRAMRQTADVLDEGAARAERTVIVETESPGVTVVRADEIERSAWRAGIEVRERLIAELRGQVEQLAALLVEAAPAARAA